MEPRISIVTLGVSDLERSVAFYRDGLGWETGYKTGEGIAFFKTWGTVFALYPIEGLAEELPDPDFKPSAGPGSIVLAHNVRAQDEVDQALALAKEAGAEIKKPGTDTFWGGYSGIFADPDGFLWEVAYGAFPIGKDGHLQLP